MKDVTEILEALQGGDRAAASELLPVLYQELRRLAAAKMAREAPGQTLQPTALVHEAWLRLVTSEEQTWENRAHFFSAAAEAMRRILIEKARRKQALRRGGGAEHADLDSLEIAGPTSDEQLLALDEALERFRLADPQKAELVKLRYYAGMTLEETADLLGISVATAKRWWTYARAWLFEEIRAGAG